MTRTKRSSRVVWSWLLGEFICVNTEPGTAGDSGKDFLTTFGFPIGRGRGLLVKGSGVPTRLLGCEGLFGRLGRDVPLEEPGPKSQTDL